MGFNNFWNDRVDEANEFLRTGRAARDSSILGRGNAVIARDSAAIARDNAVNNSLNTGASCVSTSQCPSGWGCINGACRQLNNSGSGSSGPSQGNSPSGGGPCNPNDPRSPCNSGGPNSCQQTPQCGGTGDDASNCCGTRCCSFGSASSATPGVSCSCGECPPLPGCTSFCDSYLKSNGGPGPGCSEGPEGNSCNSCTECDGNIGGECDPISIGADCYCEGGGCNAANCETCDTGTGSADFGGCGISDGCQECGTVTNHLCSCNAVLPPVTVCKPYGASGLTAINLAQQEAAQQCNEICNKDNADPCKPKTSNTTRCTDTGAGVAACPEGSTQNGFLEAGGERCVFCVTEDDSDLPDSCKECDCNCNNDCPSCQLCGADGKCQPDPLCEADTYNIEVFYTGNYAYFGYSFVGFPVGTIINCQTNVDTENERIYYAPGVPQDEVANYSIETSTTPSGNEGTAVCTSCIERDDVNDECGGTSGCPASSTTKAVYVNGNEVVSTRRTITGCVIYDGQGTFTTFYHRTGSMTMKVTPVFD